MASYCIASYQFSVTHYNARLALLVQSPDLDPFVSRGSSIKNHSDQNPPLHTNDCYKNRPYIVAFQEIPTCNIQDTVILLCLIVATLDLGTNTNDSLKRAWIYKTERIAIYCHILHLY